MRVIQLTPYVREAILARLAAAVSIVPLREETETLAAVAEYALGQEVYLEGHSERPGEIQDIIILGFPEILPPERFAIGYVITFRDGTEDVLREEQLVSVSTRG